MSPVSVTGCHWTAIEPELDLDQDSGCPPSGWVCVVDAITMRRYRRRRTTVFIAGHPSGLLFLYCSPICVLSTAVPPSGGVGLNGIRYYLLCFYTVQLNGLNYECFIEYIGEGAIELTAGRCNAPSIRMSENETVGCLVIFFVLIEYTVNENF